MFHVTYFFAFCFDLLLLFIRRLYTTISMGKHLDHFRPIVIPSVVSTFYNDNQRCLYSCRNYRLNVPSKGRCSWNFLKNASKILLFFFNQIVYILLCYIHYVFILLFIFCLSIYFVSATVKILNFAIFLISST